MGHRSTPAFRVLHAVRIKGFADESTLVEITGLETLLVRRQLDQLVADGHGRFHEARELWQLTADGRAAHRQQLDADLVGLDTTEQTRLAEAYQRFLALNGGFKSLCGEWQLRDGEVNDHADAGYDAAVIAALGELHDLAHPVVFDIAQRIERFRPYPDRLVAALERVRGGESNMFTGVMCGSYHDVWMELHEDLILTQRIDRTAEGSF